MQSSHPSLRSILTLVAVAGAAFGPVACSSDDSPSGSTGGSDGGGTTGTTGREGGSPTTGGATGTTGRSSTTGGATAGSSTGSTGGTTGTTGVSGGTNGVTGDGGRTDGGSLGDARTDVLSDVKSDCGAPSVTHTAPAPVPATIAVPSGVTLVGGYYASGEQIYTCTPAAADAGDSGAASGSWVNTAVATVFGDNCATAAQHSYTGGPPSSPTWAATDGSTVVASRIAAVAAPVADAGDAGATAITWALLGATSNTGEGVFANVTYVQRLYTTGGVGPSGACDPTADANAARHVPYTATYYFYTGRPVDGGPEAGGEAGPVEAGSEAGPGEAGSEAGPAEAGPVEAGGDATAE